jgi:putative ATP-dependent endonuclease of OLD family
LRISHVLIENYRGLKHLSLGVDDYTALIGPNGAGKSTVLYALSWFFEGGTPDEADCYQGPIGDGESVPDFISVTVTFADLTAGDRETLEKYGRGPTAVFRRVWTCGEAKSKIIGNATQGPGFSAVRSESSIVAQRTLYTELHAKLTDLPELGSKASKGEIADALLAWETDPAHGSDLEAVSSEDANHLFGAVGASTIGRLVRLVLVPASIDMASQLGTGDKKAALSELVGAMVAATSERVHSQWMEKHGTAVDELQATMKESVTASTQAQAARINGLFTQLVPSAAVKFTPTVPPLNSRMDVKVLTEVEIDGLVTDISRQGHGVQRAVMLTTLQAMVPDEDPFPDDDGGCADEYTVLERPHLIVCIEEPEIFQHPLRARNFARVLTQLAEEARTQILVATHSPYFVRPEQFASLRRFHRDGRVVSASVDTIAISAGMDRARLAKNVGKLLPTAFSEAFFSNTVTLVEGDTDRAVIEGICELLGSPLDLHDVAVVEAGSKTNLRTAFEILTHLGITVYPVADGDFGKAPAGTVPHASHETQTKEALGWFPGGQETSFGEPSYVGERFTLWQTDLEVELDAWPSFKTALNAVGGAIGRKYASHYRSAALQASDEDMPESLRLLAARLLGLVERGPDVSSWTGLANSASGVSALASDSVEAASVT